MTVKDLISKLLEMPMDAEVYISDPTPHEDEHGICKGYCFGIDDVTHDFDVELRFTDWRKEDYSKRLSDLADTEIVGDEETIGENTHKCKYYHLPDFESEE